MQIYVSGWMEKEEEGGVHMLHLVDSRGRKKCRCRFKQGNSIDGNVPSTVQVDMRRLLRDGPDGNLYLEELDGFDAPDVVLCDKSQTELMADIRALKSMFGADVLGKGEDDD